MDALFQVSRPTKFALNSLWVDDPIGRALAEQRLHGGVVERLPHGCVMLRVPGHAPVAFIPDSLDCRLTAPEYVDVTEIAKVVRAKLKAAYPGTKFSVRSSKYAGGASIHINYVDGPDTREVDQMLRPLASVKSFNMDDTVNYGATVLDDGRVVYSGANYIFAQRTHSRQALEAAVALHERLWPGSTAGVEVVEYESGNAGLRNCNDSRIYGGILNLA